MDLFLNLSRLAVLRVVPPPILHAHDDILVIPGWPPSRDLEGSAPQTLQGPPMEPQGAPKGSLWAPLGSPRRSPELHHGP